MKNPRLDELIVTLKRSDPQLPLIFIDIRRFPFRSHKDLQASIVGSTAQVRRFVFRHDTDILRILNGDRAAKTAAILTLLRLIVPLVSITLAISVSWLFLLGLACFFLGGRISNRFYDQQILKATFRSEREFCLLFYLSQIYVVHDGKPYEWQQMQKEFAALEATAIVTVADNGHIHKVYADGTSEHWNVETGARAQKRVGIMRRNGS